LNTPRKYYILVVCQLQNVIVEVSCPILTREHSLGYWKIERKLLTIEKVVITSKEFHFIICSCGFSDINSKKFAVALKYFHCRGTVLHFAPIKSWKECLKDFEVVSLHLLTKVLSYVLIAHPYQCIGSAEEKENNLFKILIEKSILYCSFLTHMLESFNNSEQVTGFKVKQEQMIDLMENFGFIAQISLKDKFLKEARNCKEKNVCIVPPLLPKDTTNLQQIPEKNVRVVYFHLPNGFLPPMLFDQMVTLFINKNIAKQEEIW